MTSSAPDRVLIGPKGLRWPWRVLMFLALVYTMSFALDLIRPLRHFLDLLLTSPEETPLPVIVVEGKRALLVIVAAAIMRILENRPFADYGLPLKQAFGKRFWQGIALGFAMLTLLLAGIGVLHGFSLTGWALTGAAAVKYGLAWALASLCIALYEDFAFRGYMQSALGDGLGFWPAALILSVIYGAIHWNNSGEALFGCVTVGIFGLVDAFALRRTGSLWLPIGMHLAWDWGESYFYGTPDSGLTATGHLLNSSFHGPKWLAGGTVGPEGSWLVLPTLLLWAVAIHFLFPAKRAAA